MFYLDKTLPEEDAKPTEGTEEPTQAAEASGSS